MMLRLKRFGLRLRRLRRLNFDHGFGLGFGLTWQLFQALIGASLLRGALYWQGGLALLLAVAVFVLLTRLVRSTPLPGGER